MAYQELSRCGMTDAELMKAVAQKDRDAFREIMQRYQTRVYRLAYRFTGSRDSAAELVQDIFFKLYLAAPRYKPEARFFTWLYRIAANHCLNYKRELKTSPLQQKIETPEPYRGLAADHESPGTQLDLLEGQERARAVRQALDRLPERQRMALMLLRFEDCSYREIAQTLECSVAAVESLIHRAMEALKNHLSPFMEQE